MVLTCSIALAGAWIGKKLKIPSGIMIGAILAVAAANVSIGAAPIPLILKVFTQIIAGAYAGASLNQKSVQKLRKLLKPACILVTAMILVNVMLGFLLYQLSPLDLCSSLFATVPGGLSEMAVISEEMGANMPLVSLFQLSRIVLVNCLFPLFITRLLNAKKAPDDCSQTSGTGTRVKQLAQKELLEFLLTLLLAGLAGSAGKKLGIPGGALLFSAIITGIMKIRFHIGIMPKWAKRLAQVLVGAYVGAQITRDVMISSKSLWPYVLLIVTCYLIVSLFAAWLITKVTTIDPVTAAFSCAPAGASEMALIASEFQVDSSTIAALQMFRMIMVIAICPSMIAALT